MKYKAEIIKNNKVVVNEYFNHFSHPNQATRYVVGKYKTRFDRFILLIANDIGDVWMYSVMMVSGRYHIRKMEKGDVVLNKNEIDMIFSGNKTILGVYS